MDLVRIFCDINDIDIKNIVNHFLRYMAFYVEEVYSWEEKHKEESLVDIFIISSYYTDMSVNIEREEKSILVLADGYNVNENYSAHKILYKDYPEKRVFLAELLRQMNEILTVRKKFENRLFFQCVAGEENEIIKSYMDHHIFESSLLARYFFENEKRFNWICRNYQVYIGDLKELFKNRESDLIRYAISYAMYEVDVACRKHSYDMLYSPEDIVETSLELMKKYEDNTENCLLIADVHFELMDLWAKAANEYGKMHLMYCAYAHYKRGRILRKYVDDIDDASISIKNALEINPAYYNAWYQQAMCCNAKNDYDGELRALCEICSILAKKDVFAPIEMEYCYKTLLQMHRICREIHAEIDVGEYFDLEKSDGLIQTGNGYVTRMDLEAVVPAEFIEQALLKDEIEKK